MRTSGGFAALVEGLLFLSLVFVLFLVTDSMHKLILAIMTIAGMLSYGIFAFLKLRQSENIQDGSEDKKGVANQKVEQRHSRQ